MRTKKREGWELGRRESSSEGTPSAQMLYNVEICQAILISTPRGPPFLTQMFYYQMSFSPNGTHLFILLCPRFFICAEKRPYPSCAPPIPPIVQEVSQDSRLGRARCGESRTVHRSSPFRNLQISTTPAAGSLGRANL